MPPLPRRRRVGVQDAALEHRCRPPAGTGRAIKLPARAPILASPRGARTRACQRHRNPDDLPFPAIPHVAKSAGLCLARYARLGLRRRTLAQALGERAPRSPSGRRKRSRSCSRATSPPSRPASRVRTQAALESVRRGEIPHQFWTFYPRGEPVHVSVRITGILTDDGRLALLFEGRPLAKEAIPPEVARRVEAFRHTGSLISLHDDQGRALTRNPAAIEAFGPAEIDRAARTTSPRSSAAPTRSTTHWPASRRARSSAPPSGRHARRTALARRALSPAQRSRHRRSHRPARCAGRHRSAARARAPRRRARRAGTRFARTAAEGGRSMP